MTNASRSRLLDDCLGARLAQSVRADRDFPPFNRAALDGYALRSEDVHAGVALRVVGTILAGAPANLTIGPGQCAAIATGAPVPEGADAVIGHERTDRGAPNVTIHADAVSPGAAIHPRGADAASGDVLIDADVTLEPHHLAIAAAAGVVGPLVRGGAPSVSILSTGDEIRTRETPTDAMAPHQIRESNATYLHHAVPSFGGLVAASEHAPDDADVTRAAVVRLLDSSDVLLTIGGISAGDRDHLPGAFAAAGVETIVRGAALQPGKPIFVGRRGRTIVVGLPGNPVSVIVTSHLFVWPILRMLSGGAARLPWRSASIATPVRPNARREAFRPARLDADGVSTPSWQGSGDLVHVGGTNGIIRLPIQGEPVEAGQSAPFLPWAWRSEASP